MSNAYVIRKYTPADEDILFDLIEREGEEWADYWKGEGRTKYLHSLDVSVSYLLFEGDRLCGYVRCHDNGGFGMCIWDLLVDASYRGKAYGRLLMEQVYRDYPDDPVYVMSDVDPYYSKLGYEVAGTIYIVKLDG